MAGSEEVAETEDFVDPTAIVTTSCGRRGRGRGRGRLRENAADQGQGGRGSRGRGRGRANKPTEMEEKEGFKETTSDEWMVRGDE